MDRFANCHYGFVEHRTEGFKFADPRFVDRYLNEELYILVRFRVREIAEDYIACFKCESSLLHAQSGIGSSVGSGHSLQFTKVGIGGVDMLGDAPIVDESTAGNQEAMLVNIIEAMESPEGIVPSLVWLDFANQAHSIFPHSLYFSTEGFLVFWGERDIVGDWETGVRSRFIPVGSHQCAGEIIEGTPKVLENVSGDKAQMRGNNKIFLETIKRLLCLRIALYNDGVWVRIGEPAKLDLKVLEVLLGPLCF